MKLSRVPIESTAPIAWFGLLRLAIVVAGIAATLIFDVPHRTPLLILGAGVALPWAIGIRLAVARTPDLLMHPAIAVVDILILAVIELVVPQTYAGVCFLVVFLVAAHAHFLGQQLGIALAVLAVVVFVPIAAFGDPPVKNGLLAFSEVLFAAATLASGVFMGRLRTAESTGRVRARELSRRAIEAEAAVRRRLAESIHDGPVQELVSLDMMLDTARRALERNDPKRAEELIEFARELAERNIGALRDEIVALGPYAFDELTLDVALEQCTPTWQRRYEVEIGLTIERIDLGNDACGALFGIAQEAVANAGRHGEASHVFITVRTVNDEVELRVSDNGSGFDGQEPLGPNEPGHIGLATMRERAELIGGRLEIRTGEKGTTVLARVPLKRALEQEVPADSPLHPASRDGSTRSG